MAISLNSGRQLKIAFYRVKSPQTMRTLNFSYYFFQFNIGPFEISMHFYLAIFFYYSGKKCI